MSKYCPECGTELNDVDEFCSNCGTKLNKNAPTENKNLKLIAVGLTIIIVILSALILMTTIKTNTELIIESDSVLTTSDEFIVKLTADGKSLSNGKIHFVFDDNGKAYEFDAETDSEGIARITPNLNAGNYEVACKFEGDDKYSESYADISLTIEESEPDYRAYSYTHSFGDTDTNGDGYVLLSDMNIAHTPKNIQNQMFADSDDNHDGKLNENEYYKFMYKLNYDKASYGL
ncbi:zinc-ribbon domain-containing protein [Methanobrevibacter sp.]|uniref:zinc-ribbon domain-containing protein n=1 Tax=Methanobrevibacter sp. TaxID=66852 RepID=UPI0025D19777|nr:zinc-ribbon domain-containing protein [Methanobrevibacter sp.]MBQ6512316.1 zinc-ribbon domain-containing protein [Methanobrevibacter sp.]